MLKAIIVALSSLLIVPTVQFTNDSVYTNNKILTITVKENYEDDILTSKDLIFTENDVIGYNIYDDPSTPYIDGLKFDDAWVYDWIVTDFNTEIEHTIYIKTVYSDDIIGTLEAARNGDWSKVLENPVILLQLFYYIIAAISIILGGFGLVKSKKLKIKSADEIATLVNDAATYSANDLQTKALQIVNDIVAPAFNKLKTQNQDIIEALVLTRNGDKDATLALLDLLKNTSTEDINAQTEIIREAILNSYKVTKEVKDNALSTIKQISNGVYTVEEQSENEDGTSI